MKCLKCDEGKLTKIKLKTTNKYAYLCEFCGTIWSENESFSKSPGHVLEITTTNDKQEYSFEDIELDQESQDISYARFR